MPGVSVSRAALDSLRILPKLSLYFIGPWLALSVLNIEWWKLTPYFQYVTLNVLNVMAIPFIFALIHLLDLRSTESLLHFVRSISPKIWLSLGAFTAWIVFSASLFHIELTNYSGIPLLSALAFLQVSLFLALPAGMIIWRLLFREGVQRNADLLTQPLIKAGYFGTGWSLFWRTAVILGPITLVAGFVPSNFLVSALSLLLMLFADTYVYVLSRQFFREPAIPSENLS